MYLMKWQECIPCSGLGGVWIVSKNRDLEQLAACAIEMYRNFWLIKNSVPYNSMTDTPILIA